MPHPILPTAQGISAALSPDYAHIDIRVYNEIDSTNTQAKRLACQGVTGPVLLVAHAQTAGRGRLERRFYSPPGSGLYMTLMFTTRKPLAKAVDVTPASAVAVCESLEALYGKQPAIKWVNDLYLDGKKICGILTEAVALPETGGHYIIVGIGINITTEQFPEDMRHPAGAVMSPEDAPPDLSRLAAEITQRLLGYLEDVAAPRALAGYRARLMLTGKELTFARSISSHAELITGIAEGVDEHYRLLLRRPDGRLEVLSGGEVTSVKP